MNYTAQVLLFLKLILQKSLFSSFNKKEYIKE